MLQVAQFSARADVPDTHPLKVYLFRLISIKRSNLCVSADVHSTTALLRLAEEVGDYICVLKTHADIVDDFGERTIKGLRDISRRKKFLLFEDRKFGDIGNTVQTQYTRGPCAIASWAHLVNAHIFPGPAIIPALKSAADSTLDSLIQNVSTEISVGTPQVSSDGEEDEFDFSKEPPGRSLASSERKGSVVMATTTISQTFEGSKRTPASLAKSFSAGEGEDGDREEALDALGEPPHARGLLLFAEMSTEGNLMDATYTKKCVEAAREHQDFVVGFISQHSLNERKNDNFVSMTPGVNLPSPSETTLSATTGDGLGQQYRTPVKVVAEDGCDIIIVGRGILKAKDRAKEAERYRDAAWKAYESRIGRAKR